MKDELKRLRDENKRLRQELCRDHLTGLFNARALSERLNETLANMEKEGREPALLFIDVDRFKEINEGHGHAAAGKILGQVGKLLGAVIRRKDVAFRYGGDEFVVLVSGGQDGARRVGERIRRAIEAHAFRARSRERTRAVRLTVSIGFRVLRPGDSARDILEAADRAMFEAKRNSRNCLVAA